MRRFLALKMVNENPTFLVIIGNVVLSTNNKVRLVARIIGTALITVVGTIVSNIPTAILIILMTKLNIVVTTGVLFSTCPRTRASNYLLGRAGRTHSYLGYR